MSWPNVRLIFLREMRDQLRDRRTLFMIAVLPILFYPLLGVSFFQIAQFLKKHESRVLIVGEESVKEIPGLFEGETFSSNLTEQVVRVKFRELESLPFFRKYRDEFVSPDGPRPDVLTEFKNQLLMVMEEEDCHAVLYYPPGVAQKFTNYAVELAERRDAGQSAPPLPEPKIVSPMRTDAESMTAGLLKHVVKKHDRATKDSAAEQRELDELVREADPIVYRGEGSERRINTSLWSKILPFVLMIWAVTGAFYPAVDLCAGEKERGTLETLLSSPARRSEIVMGKLFTVMMFSIATAMLNLTVMFGTGAIVLSQIEDLAKVANVGPPPLAAFAWSLLLIVPVSVLVSAVCLALAALAKSTKEGQHYLAPVMLVALPLTLLPMAPQVELNFAFSLVPISGIVLVMRSLLEGTFFELWPYAIIVAVVTFFCCWWSIRWAVEQFNSESVLFREGERWTLGTWLRHLARDRQDTPSAAQALLCGLVILIVSFFLSVFLAKSFEELLARGTFADLFKSAFISIVVGVALPALLFSIMLTRSPRRTLQLGPPTKLLTIPVAALLALAAIPLSRLLLEGLQVVLPMTEATAQLEQLAKLFDSAPNVLAALGVIALMPAVFEELAFRGFILSGFRHTGHKWRAIALSSIFFALAHSIVYQEINALLLGLILGYLAIQTGSIWPCMTFHFVFNASQYLLFTNQLPLRHYVEEVRGEPALYVPILLASVALGALLFFYLQRLPYRRTREEDLVEAIQRENAHQLA
ncbi:MAG: CPBP family intramembrane metalloprotease [Planctomycetota bacterium]|nr:MAG: CPBP family intramembrane metalloprotease [Planctomycetota bacterium]REK38472.1 MAG: CPBP family intramembrane metalloprotease [Planctomycetota bacterium]